MGQRKVAEGARHPDVMFRGSVRFISLGFHIALP